MGAAPCRSLWRLIQAEAGGDLGVRGTAISLLGQRAVKGGGRRLRREMGSRMGSGVGKGRQSSRETVTSSK